MSLSRCVLHQTSPSPLFVQPIVHDVARLTSLREMETVAAPEMRSTLGPPTSLARMWRWALYSLQSRSRPANVRCGAQTMRYLQVPCQPQTANWCARNLGSVFLHCVHLVTTLHSGHSTVPSQKIPTQQRLSLYSTLSCLRQFPASRQQIPNTTINKIELGQLQKNLPPANLGSSVSCLDSLPSEFHCQPPLEPSSITLSLFVRLLAKTASLPVVDLFPHL